MRKIVLSNDQLSAICMELSLLLHAGVNVADGLVVMAQQETDPRQKTMLEDMANQVDNGGTLCEAVTSAGCFPHYVCALLSVGEQSGHVEPSLQALAEYYQNRARMDKQIRGAILYPSMLLLVMLVVIVTLLWRVLPIFNDVYSALGGRLSGVAGMLLDIGETLGGMMPLLVVGLGILLAGLLIFAVSGAVRARFGAMWRRLRGDKGLAAKLNAARFAQSMSMAMSSGMGVDEAMNLSAQLLEDIPSTKNRIAACQSAVQQGESVAMAMAQAGILPKTQSRLLELGIHAGAGERVMHEISKQLFEGCEYALDKMVARIEPTLVAVTSVIVGVILMSVMLPLMNIMSVIG